jgi:hypothetical protein
MEMFLLSYLLLLLLVKRSRLLTYKPRAPYLWLVRPPPSQALWRSLMLAPSQSAALETRDVRCLSGQLGSWLSLSSDGSQRSDCCTFVFGHTFLQIWFIWLSLAAAAALGPDWIIFEDRLCVHQWLNWIRWDKSLSVCECVCEQHIWKRNTCLFETKRQRFLG